LDLFAREKEPLLGIMLTYGLKVIFRRRDKRTIRSTSYHVHSNHYYNKSSCCCNKLKSIVVTSNKIVVFDVIDGSIECLLLYRSMYSVVSLSKFYILN
jgi:hypothetical protein